MAKILITNVGNRTLIKQNAEKVNLEFIQEGTFKDQTMKWYESQEESVLKDLEINIIDKVFAEESGITHAYLFTSDQQGANASEKKQDTLYAGALLEIIMPQRLGLPQLIVESIALTASVVDIDQLAKAFRNEIRKIIEKHPESTFIICDSGGTPQQKTALKLVTEYLAPEGKTTVYQVMEQKDEEGMPIAGKGKASKQNLLEIRNIADAQNIGLLIDRGEYAAAAAIGERSLRGQEILKYLKALDHRLHRLDKEAYKAIFGSESIPSAFAKSYTFKTMQNYLQGEPSGNYTTWSAYIIKVDFFKVCEILETARFHWYLGNWSEVVLWYQFFIEAFVDSFIRKKGYDPGSKRSMNPVLNTQMVKNITGWNSVALSGQSKIAYFITEAATVPIKTFGDDFRSCQSTFISVDIKGLDKLRNNGAHGGVGSTKAEILQFVPDFERLIESWHDRLEVSKVKQDNVYAKANEEIKAHLKIL